MDDLDFFSEVVIADVIKSQRDNAARKAQVPDKTIFNSQQPNLQVTVSQEPKGLRIVEDKEAVLALPNDALWRSSLMQNYVHCFLRQNRLLEPLTVGRLAVHLGVTYDSLKQYLDDVYPQRSRLLLTDE